MPNRRRRFLQIDFCGCDGRRAGFAPRLERSKKAQERGDSKSGVLPAAGVAYDGECFGPGSTAERRTFAEDPIGLRQGLGNGAVAKPDIGGISNFASGIFEADSAGWRLKRCGLIEQFENALGGGHWPGRAGWLNFRSFGWGGKEASRETS